MFKKEYQGGSHVEVFSAQGRDPVAQWKLSGPVKREYDRQVRGYVYVMEGGSSTTRMQLPKSEKAMLGLVQPYCVFQLLVPSEARFTIDLSVLDGGGSKRRIQLSTSLREPSTSPLNARAPLTAMLTGQWLNLCVDMGSLVGGLFRGQVFKSLEGVTLGGNCMVRRIYTLRAPPPDTVGGQEGVEGIPRACQMPVAAGLTQTQVLTYASVSEQQTSAGSTADHASPLSSHSVDSRPTHVAFGSKVTIPDHIIHSRQTSRSTGSGETTARVKSGGATSSRPSQMVDASGSPRQSGTRGGGAASVDGHGLQPRPPSHPADPSMLRIQRKRVRLIGSGGRRRETANPDEKKPERTSSQRHQPQPQPEVAGSRGSHSNEPAGISVSASNSVTTVISGSDSGYRTSHPLSEESSSEDVLHGGRFNDSSSKVSDQNTSLMVEGEEEDEEEEEEGEEEEEEGEEEEEEEEETSGFLDTSAESAVTIGAGLDSSVLSSEGGMELSSREEDSLYLYRSPPKSAGRRQHSVGPLVESVGASRGAGLDEDFVSHPANEPNEEGSPHRSRGRGVVSDVHQLAETRLSDDYDWRQYASVDGDDLTQSDMSLRTRLAHAPHPPTHTLPLPTTTTHSNSSEMESTLSGSMTLSGWTERFKDATRSPIFDSLDTRGMGGTLSPAMGTLTDQSDLGMEEAWQEGEEEVELMYDPQLNCFYDPHTCKYYELAQ